MKALLDTHAFLWWCIGDPRLTSTARRFIDDGDNDIYLSVASAWEIAIKAGRGQLALPTDPESYVLDRMSATRILPLPIMLRHALHVARLPEYHRDPFDRMLVAQSQLDDIPLITSDAAILRYGTEIIW